MRASSHTELAISIVQRLYDAGYEAYFAGGWVRDKLLGTPSDDIDIATSATPRQVMALFDKTVPVGMAFGSVLVVEKGFPFEVTTFRQDLEYRDGRHPEAIAFSSAEEDAKRRDLTINGMFYDPLENRVIDYVGGQEDLEAGIVRAIGEPDRRFEEDRLRLIRALRFAARLNFVIEKGTAEAIRRHAPTLFPHVAIERIWQEFSKMAGHPAFAAFLVGLHDFGLLQEIFPTLASVPLEEIAQRVRSFAQFPKDGPTILYVLELFPKAPLKERLALCDRMKLSRADTGLAELLTRAEELSLESELVEWVHFYADSRSKLCLGVLAARLESSKSFEREHAKRRERLQDHIERVREKQPLLSARRLMDAGIAPGPLMGLLLAEAERLAVEHNIDDPDELLALLKRSLEWPRSR